MLQDKTGKTYWYVIFTQAKFDHWIWRIMSKDVGHVYAVQDINEYQWLVVQPRVNVTEIKILNKYDYPVIGMIAGNDDKILRVEVNLRVNLRGGLNWFNCVEQVKALLGIKSFFTFTPLQLYNGLKAGRYGH